MSRIPRMIASVLVKGRVFAFLLALAMTTFFLLHALKISFNFSPESIFIEDDPAYQFYEQTYLKAYEHMGAPCMLAIKVDNDEKKLAHYLKMAQERLGKNPYVTHVVSPFQQMIMKATPQGFEPSPAVGDDGLLSKDARAYFQAHPLFSGSFLGKDPSVMALIFMPHLKFQDQDWQSKAVLSIESDIEKLKKEMPNAAVYVTGLPIIQHEMVALLKSDQLIFMPILAAFLLILLMVMTKHPLGAVFPLMVIVVALVWTVGYLALIGHDINVVNNAIFILIMVIGIADAVHIYTRFGDECQQALKKNGPFSKEAVLVEVMSAMLVPCLLTSLTTALGFVASSAAGVSIIKQFGMDAAVGVMFCFVVTMMMMPFLLSLHPRPRLKVSGKKAYGIDALLHWSLKKSLRYAKPLSIGAVILIGISAYVGRHIAANQTWIGELPANNQAVKSLNFIEENFTGVMPFYVVFSGSHDRLSSYDAAKAMHVVTQKLRQHAIKPTIRSPIDTVNFMLENSHPPLSLTALDDDTYQELLGAMKKLQQGGDSVDDPFWSKDGQHVRIIGFLANADTAVVEKFREDLQALMKEQSLAGITIHATGPALISSNALHNLTHDMASSIMLAILYIAIFMALFFRSIRFSLIAMLPNLLPIALTIAFMDVVGIDVRLATVMIFSMALGLSIDTCIHLLCRVLEETSRVSDRFKRLSFIRALYHAFRGSGRPIIYTTIILLGGFSVMMFSRFMALRDFAFISGTVLLVALVSDIVLLPALLFIFRPKA